MTKKDAAKIRQLYELYEQPMYRIAFAVLHDEDDAEDAVSDAFMKLIGKIGHIAEPESLEAKNYVIRTIKSSAIDIYRRNRKFFEKCTPIDEDTVLISDPTVNVERDVLGEKESELLEGLSETDRRIFMLRCRNELSWREVAERLSMTETAVRKRFERARKELIRQRGGE